MSRPREPIRKLRLADGTVRWRAVVDTGTNQHGRRVQATRTFPTRRQAQAFVAATRVSVIDQTYVQPSQVTVAEYLHSWLNSRVHTVRPKTLESYRGVLDRASRAFGTKRLDQLTKGDILAVVADMRERDKPLSARTVNLTLGLLRQALNTAVRDGLLLRNPAMQVDRLPQPVREMDAWTGAEAARFLHATREHPWAGPFALSLSGLRRGEVLGARWSDIELDPDPRTGTVAHIVVRRSRVQLGHAGGGVSEGEPKSLRSRRTVPLAPFAVTALNATRGMLAHHRTAAAGAYHDGDFVCANELGQPPRPETYSAVFHRLTAEAGLRPVRLHDLRHTSVTLMLGAGIPVHIVAAVHGHDPVITQRIYAHTRTDDAARAMSALDQILRNGDQGPGNQPES